MPNRSNLPYIWRSFESVVVFVNHLNGIFVIFRGEKCVRTESGTKSKREEKSLRFLLNATILSFLFFSVFQRFKCTYIDRIDGTPTIPSKKAMRRAEQKNKNKNNIQNENNGSSHLHWVLSSFLGTRYYWEPLQANNHIII